MNDGFGVASAGIGAGGSFAREFRARPKRFADAGSRRCVNSDAPIGGLSSLLAQIRR
jgi:hypothetical protein